MWFPRSGSGGAGVLVGGAEPRHVEEKASSTRPAAIRSGVQGVQGVLHGVLPGWVRQGVVCGVQQEAFRAHAGGDQNRRVPPAFVLYAAGDGGEGGTETSLPRVPDKEGTCDAGEGSQKLEGVGKLINQEINILLS
eukprot:COSAG05_NODE_520_length_9047_cov_2.500224_4_plen_136_part_00